MNNGYPEDSCWSRRAFLGSLSASFIAMLSGCGGPGADDSSTNSTFRDTPSNGSTKERRIIQQEVEKLESIYEALSQLPITNRGKFVFDVNRFEAEFEHEALLNQADDAHDEFDSIPKTEQSTSTVVGLISITETGKLLVQQRVILHQVITAGLTSEHSFYETDFERANDAISDALQFLIDLDSHGEQIEETMIDDQEVISLVDGYDPNSIQRSQKLLVNIVSWSDSAFKGLHHTSRGMKLFLEGNSALDREKYHTAETAYRESREHYELAQQALDDALGIESALPYIAPFVDDVRCVLPAYLSSTERLSESMRLIRNGEQTRGRELAREATNSSDRIASRCF